ncbi:PI-PLC X domain-containing protein At5g67130-like isoform X2 [Phaseolus vulgaris]|uniref:PI-PLC X domain-containing protein At5g67130-like isoform X2 n=1 Tax=Phaseolus vulgaris TaxID=3885 RepID=UPI0035CB91C7
MGYLPCLLSVIILALCCCVDAACSNGKCKLNDECSSNGDCGPGLYCFSCPLGFSGSRCVRSSVTDPFKLINNSLPFNKYAFLTTHNSFAIHGEPSNTGVPRVTITNQEDSVTQQLKNGVRGLMLDTYDFDGDVWLCHSFRGHCHDFTAFEPAIDTLKEIAAFLSANPKEIVTLILDDYVETPKALKKVFTEAGLMKFWFPVMRMTKKGGDWPLVSDMVAKNQRLLVFTSISSKQQSEGIAYQWNYMVENQYGDGGRKAGRCLHRKESSALDDKSRSLVLINYFRTFPLKPITCEDNSGGLIDMLQTCHDAAGNRWANYVAVDYYKRSEGGGSFKAVDTLNGKLLCGCDDVHACVVKKFSFFLSRTQKLVHDYTTIEF